MALCGGVRIGIPQTDNQAIRRGDIHAADGFCRAFDAEAGGTVFGNGLVVVVLKGLSEALRDGDHIYARIKGTAVNNDGGRKASFTAPSIEGQAAVIAEALAVSGVSPDTIGYVEGHGTGTVLGDPIEVAALTRAYRGLTTRKGFCALGSVKTNIGHLDAAAGIAGLLKAVLALQHKTIPPTLHFRTPNPQIDFANSPFFVNSEALDWKDAGHPRRAGVSSFGIGGTNAHVILEEAPPLPPPRPSRGTQILPLSAKSPEALQRVAGRLRGHLAENPALNLADTAFTLQVGRQAFPHRRVLVCQRLEEAATLLETGDLERNCEGHAGEKPAVAFLFPGQGAQYAGMARDLYRAYPAFRRHFERCRELFRPCMEWDLKELVFPSSRHAPQAKQGLSETRNAQPALFAIEYSMAKLWMEWGVHPEVMLGHSLGEYVAACLSGVFPLEEAAPLVAYRGQLMQEMPPGAMLAVSAPEERSAEALGTGLSVAAINSPAQYVLSGTPEAIAAEALRLQGQGLPCRRLEVSHAFHSEAAAAAGALFLERLRSVRFHPPRIPILSNVHGRRLGAEEAQDPAYWAAHLRQTVLFSEGVKSLCAAPRRVFLEVGPGRVLGALAEEHLEPGRRGRVISSDRSPGRTLSGEAAWMMAAGRLWVQGVEMDWRAVHGKGRRRIPLPTYPFERARHWIEPDETPSFKSRKDKSAASNRQESELRPPVSVPNAQRPQQGADTYLESVLAIWRELLGSNQVSPDDNFFTLGGNSLLGITLTERIGKDMGVVLPIGHLFNGMTPRKMAANIRKMRSRIGTER